MNYKIILFLVLLRGTSIISAYGQDNRICPYGSYLGKDSFGNQACLDSKSNQVVSSPNIAGSTSGSQSTSSSGGNGTIIGIIFLIVIVIIVGIAKSRRKSSSYVERTEFSRATKEAVKKYRKEDVQNVMNILIIGNLTILEVEEIIA